MGPPLAILFVLNTLPGAALTLPEAARMAAEQSYPVRLAQARLVEVQALQIGAGAAAPSNPELALTVGPGFVNASGPPATEFMVTLSWPIELSGAFAWRRDWAAARGVEGDAELRAARLQAAFGAGDLYVRAQGARERVVLAEARSALDAEVLRISQVRRAAGSVGEGDVALAQVMQGEGAALVQTARGDVAALEVLLRQSLGIDEAAPLTLEAPRLAAPAALADLVRRSQERPSVQHAMRTEAAAQLNSTLQGRAGWPVPKVSLAAGRGPEYQGEVGLMVPLPVYQRNQTQAAVSAAEALSRGLSVEQERRSATSDVQAAHAEFTGAQGAFDTLMATVPALDDAEHLALRSYELGQQAMPSVLVARRETMNARAALLEARVRRDRASWALAFATGSLPGLSETP